MKLSTKNGKLNRGKIASLAYLVETRDSKKWNAKLYEKIEAQVDALFDAKKEEEEKKKKEATPKKAKKRELESDTRVEEFVNKAVMASEERTRAMFAQIMERIGEPPKKKRKTEGADEE